MPSSDEIQPLFVYLSSSRFTRIPGRKGGNSRAAVFSPGEQNSVKGNTKKGKAKHFTLRFRGFDHPARGSNDLGWHEGGSC